jgi:predicted phosphodiesterase
MIMNIVALSDLHGYLPDNIPACDLLLLAGDLCPIENHDHTFHAEWLDREFRAWLRRLPARQIIGIAGNHDLVFEREPELVPRDLPWTYLQDSGVTWEGIKIWGTPWQPWFFDWAFNGQPEQLREIWAKIPDDTDILVVHGPPRGYGDGIPMRQGIRHTGCPHLLERIRAIAPRLVVFGHIHEGRGQWTIGNTILANVTVLNEAYEPAYEPWQMEWRWSTNSA